MKVFIPCVLNGEAALRIFDNKQQKFYGSTRLGSINKTGKGVEVNLPDEFEGKAYELRETGSKKIIAEGIIQSEPSAQLSPAKRKDDDKKAESVKP